MSTQGPDETLIVKKHVAMGQNPVPPVNISIPTKIDKWLVHLPQNGTMGFDPPPCSKAPFQHVIIHRPQLLILQTSSARDEVQQYPSWSALRFKGPHLADYFVSRSSGANKGLQPQHWQHLHLHVNPNT